MTTSRLGKSLVEGSPTIYLSVCPSICSSIYLSDCLSIYLCRGFVSDSLCVFHWSLSRIELTLLNQCLKAHLRNCQKNFHSPCFKRNPPSSVFGWFLHKSLKPKTLREGQGAPCEGVCRTLSPKSPCFCWRGWKAANRAVHSVHLMEAEEESSGSVCDMKVNSIYFHASKTFSDGITKGNKGKRTTLPCSCE